MKNTTDIWFGSFLLSKGHNVKDYDIIKKGKGRYYFDLTDDEWKELKLEFGASNISELKAYHTKLKDFVY